MKKMLILMLAAALLLCGCGGPEPFDPVVERPAIELPEPQIDPNATVGPVEEIPELPQSEETPVEEIEPQPVTVQVNVEDAFAQTYNAVYYDGTYCVHIPRFVWNGQTDMMINEQIYIDHQRVLNENTYNGQPTVSAAYALGQANGYASVITCFRQQEYEYVQYSIFHINAATGQEATDSEILAAYGYTPDTFRAAVRTVMEKMFVSANAFLADGADDATYQQMMADHLSDSNIASARPYIDADGQLCFMVKFYIFAGAGYYYNCICLENPDRIPTPEGIRCTVHG